MDDQSNDKADKKNDIKELDPSNLQSKDNISDINLDDIDLKGWAKSRGKKK